MNNANLEQFSKLKLNSNDYNLKKYTMQDLLNDNLRAKEINKRSDPNSGEPLKSLNSLSRKIRSTRTTKSEDKYNNILETHGAFIRDLHYLEEEFPNKYSNIILNDNLFEKVKNAMRRTHTPKSIINIFNKNKNELKYHLCNLAAEMGRVDILEWARKQEPPLKWGYDTCAIAAKAGHLKVLRWLRNKNEHDQVLDLNRERNNDFCNWNVYTCTAAAENGHFEILKWCRNREIHGNYICPWASYFHCSIINTCDFAAKAGHLNILRWLCNRTDEDQILTPRGDVCHFEPNVYSNAARNGHLEILKWAFSQWIDYGYQNYYWLASQRRQYMFSNYFTNACTEAAKGGHLHILRWLRNRTDQDQILNEDRETHNRLYPWGSSTLFEAAKGGHLHILEWCLDRTIHNNDICTNTTDICRGAALGGHLHIIEWANEHNFNIGGVHTCANAAKNGHFNILKRVRELGCQWNAETCIEAARNGYLDILQWARERNCPWQSNEESACTAAAEGGHLHILKWLRNRIEDDQILDQNRENDAGICPWRYKTCYYAIKGGHFEILKWAKVNGCPWEPTSSIYAEYNSCAEAARIGRLDILQWCRNEEIHMNDICPWNENTCTAAASNGYLDILMWVKDNSCDWNYKTCNAAIKKGYLDILLWLINKDYSGQQAVPNRNIGICPQDTNNNNLIFEATFSEQFEILQWLIKNNFPYNLHYIINELDDNQHVKYGNTDIKLYFKEYLRQEHVGGNIIKKTNHLFENITLFGLILISSILSSK